MRALMFRRVEGLSAQTNGNQVTLVWAPTMATDGYYVYRGADLENALAAGPIAFVTSENYTTPIDAEEKTYAVRARKLTTTGAGSFYNLGQAAVTTPPW